jgi:hypothetical protein
MTMNAAISHFAKYRSSHPMAVIAVLVSISLLVSPAAAIDWEHDLRGFVKEYPSLALTDSTTDWLTSTRGRLKFRWFPTYSLTFVADYEATVTTGSIVGSESFGALSTVQTERGELFDLSWQLVNTENVYVTHTIDRLYAEYYHENVVLTLGRQRIAWGVSDYFRPLDQFAPFTPGEIDTEERAGIDAARVSFSWDRLSNIELVVSPRSHFDNSRIGGRIRTNIDEWDIGAIVGWFEDGTVLGGSFSGALGGAGVKGEALAVYDGYARTNMTGSPPTYREVQKTYLKATLGGSYGFNWRNLTVSGEAYYDGSGASNPAGYDVIGLATGRRVTVGRYYAAATASALAHPLVTLSATTLMNLTDNSALISPSLVWSARQTIDVTVGAQVFIGGTQDEYGVQANALYVVLAWYF